MCVEYTTKYARHNIIHTVDSSPNAIKLHLMANLVIQPPRHYAHPETVPNYFHDGKE